MTYIDRGFYLEAKADPPPRGVALPIVSTWQRTSFLTPSWARLVAEGYNANAAVNICVTRLALAYQQPRPVVKSPSGEPLPQHPLQLLLNAPTITDARGSRFGYNQFAIFVKTYRAIGGNAYIWKRRSAAGRVVSLHPFHAGNIEVFPGETELIDCYVYDSGDGKKFRLEPEDVIHLRWPSVDPTQPWLALAPLRAVAREVDTDTEATRYMYALLANDATPRSVVEMPENATLSEPEYNRMKQSFQQRFGGDMRGDVAILEGGAKLNRLSLNMEELAFAALRSVPEARIASSFLIPVEYSGLNVGLEHSTYANVAEARAGFFEDTIQQFCALDAAELTADLAPEFGEGITVDFDFSKVVALQENEDRKYTRVISGWDKGLLGRKEARVKLGLPDELPEGDEFKAAPLALGPPAEPSIPKGLRQIGTKAARAVETIETRVRRDVARYLAAQYAQAAARVEAMG